MFDILKAKENFMNYVRQFDLTNDKIHLKLVHTFPPLSITIKEIIPPFLVYLNYHTLSYYIFFLLGSYAPQAPSGLPP